MLKWKWLSYKIFFKDASVHFVRSLVDCCYIRISLLIQNCVYVIQALYQKEEDKFGYCKSSMTLSITILVSIVILLLKVEVASLYHIFHESNFTFSTWRDSDEGFNCSPNQTYVVMCRNRWSNIEIDMHHCTTQCAHGGKAVLTAIIIVESITIGALLVYAYRKPRIVEKERVKIQKWITTMAVTDAKNKISNNI